jgi:hypothetical protein
MLNSRRFHTKPKSNLSIAIIIISFIMATLVVQAAVELKYFRAEPQSDNTILLKWETATELDHAAFFLSRAESAGGDYQELGSFPAEGDSVSGAIYEYVDSDVQEGLAYYYKLEDMDTSGNITLAHPVIFSGINVDTPTPTPAPTDTPEPTDTPTPNPTATPTPQATDTPTHTPTTVPTTVFTATFTPVSTATLVSTNTPTTIPSNTPVSTATSAPGVSPTAPPATVEPTNTPVGSTPVADTPTPAATPEEADTPTPMPALTPTSTPPLPPAPTTSGQAPPPTASSIIFPTPTPEVKESSGSGIQNILLGIGLVALLAAAGLAFYAIRMWRQPPEDQA